MKRDFKLSFKKKKKQESLEQRRSTPCPAIDIEFWCDTSATVTENSIGCPLCCMIYEPFLPIHASVSDCIGSIWVWQLLVFLLSITKMYSKTTSRVHLRVCPPSVTSTKIIVVHLSGFILLLVNDKFVSFWTNTCHYWFELRTRIINIRWCGRHIAPQKKKNKKTKNK